MLYLLREWMKDQYEDKIPATQYLPYYAYITSQVFNAGKKSATFN